MKKYKPRKILCKRDRASPFEKAEKLSASETMEIQTPKRKMDQWCKNKQDTCYT